MSPLSTILVNIICLCSNSNLSLIGAFFTAFHACTIYVYIYYVCCPLVSYFAFFWHGGFRQVPTNNACLCYIYFNTVNNWLLSFWGMEIFLVGLPKFFFFILEKINRPPKQIQPFIPIFIKEPPKIFRFPGSILHIYLDENVTCKKTCIFQED